MSADIDEIIKKIKNNSSDENRKFADDLRQGLSAGENEMLAKLMADKDSLRKLLESEQVKNIMNKLRGGNNGNK